VLQDAAEGGAVDGPAPGRSRRARLATAAAALLVTATLVITVAAALSLSGRPASAPSPTAPDATAAAPTPAPADPRTVFRDPALRALAEPFLVDPAARCEQTEPIINVAESVMCELGRGRLGLFTKVLTADAMRGLRDGFLAGQLAEPGTVRSLRWRYVEGRPGARTGIPPDENDPGEGVRVRYVDNEGVPRLYFDQDSSACIGYLALAEPTGDDEADLEALRSYWANPAE
jgi:hypothetical protein